MKFSLILATVERTKEVERFLDNLDKQIYRDFELIIVDQNGDDCLVPIVASYNNRFQILHLRLSTRGVSRARNFGLKYVSGDIVAFPDDDCWYPPDLLGKVSHVFEERFETEGIVIRSVDQNGMPSTSKGSDKAQPINLINVQWLVVAFAIFLRKAVVDKVGLFDETLGVGADTPWGAGEETDYLIRATKESIRLYYFPVLFVYHPKPTNIFDSKYYEKAYKYASGWGRVARKYYPIHFFIYFGIIRSLGGIVFALVKGRFVEVQYRRYVLAGKVKGWLSSIKH